MIKKIFSFQCRDVSESFINEEEGKIEELIQQDEEDEKIEEMINQDEDGWWCGQNNLK